MRMRQLPCKICIKSKLCVSVNIPVELIVNISASVFMFCNNINLYTIYDHRFNLLMVSPEIIMTEVLSFE